MEMKAMSFLLPFLLLVTTRFSTSVEASAILDPCEVKSCHHASIEEVDTEAMAPPPEKPHGSHPLILAPAAHSPEKPNHHAPAHSPEKPYHHAPAHSPEKPYHHAPAHSPEKPYHHAPSHSPEKPHDCHHGPGKGPCHKREKHHYHHAPGKAPSHEPEEHHHHRGHAPMHPPVVREGTPFPNRKPNCSTRCGKYCKKEGHKKEEEKECVDVCTVCCKKYECVPRENNKKCKWSDFEMEGKPVKCHR